MCFGSTPRDELWGYLSLEGRKYRGLASGNFRISGPLGKWFREVPYKPIESFIPHTKEGSPQSLLGQLSGKPERAQRSSFRKSYSSLHKILQMHSGRWWQSSSSSPFRISDSFLFFFFLISMAKGMFLNYSMFSFIHQTRLLSHHLCLLLGQILLLLSMALLSGVSLA